MNEQNTTSSSQITNSSPPSQRLIGFYIASICILVALGLHFYLAKQSYSLMANHAIGKSLCDVSEKLSCTIVTASSYSKLFGIPLAIWGAITNLILLFMMLIYRFIASDSKDPMGRYALWVAGLIAATSVVMGLISTFLLSAFCPFCVANYVLSFITLFAVIYWIRQPILPTLALDIKSLTNKNRSALFLFLAIPAGAWLSNGIIRDQLKIPDLKKAAKQSIAEWESNTLYEFNTTNSISYGAPGESAKMTIVEFADFLCPHCIHAAPILHAFVSSRNDVRLAFMNFPLDPLCNEALNSNPQHKTDGVRCRLARLSYCANSLGHGEKGLEWLFENSVKLRTNEEVESAMSKMASTLNLSQEELKSCEASVDADEAVRKMAKQGARAGVPGTPALFVNGRILYGAQYISILEKAHEHILNNRTMN